MLGKSMNVYGYLHYFSRCHLLEVVKTLLLLRLLEQLQPFPIEYVLLRMLELMLTSQQKICSHVATIVDLGKH